METPPFAITGFGAASGDLLGLPTPPGPLILPAAVPLEPRPPTEGDQVAAVTAAHNAIYDNHSPLRVAQVLRLVNNVPQMNQADMLATGAMLLANVLLHTEPTARMNVISGLVSVAGGLLRGMSQDAPGDLVPPPGA